MLVIFRGRLRRQQQNPYLDLHEHMCLKHVEAWNKLVIKFSASSWLILRNKYIEMYGQQNIKI